MIRYHFYRLAASVRHWLPRRFTPAGLLALAGLLTSGAISVDMDQTVAFQGFALMACLLAVSAVGACFFRGRFVVQRTVPRLGSVGQPFTYRVRVRNETTKAFPDLELFEDLVDARLTLDEFIAAKQLPARMTSFRLESKRSPAIHERQAHINPASLPGLPPNGEIEVPVELLPLRRGPLRFTGVTLGRRDPIGLVRGFVRRPLPQTVIILPKRYALPALALPGSRTYQPRGVVLASTIGESDEFMSLRDYRPGDPMGHIHWRSWARVGRPIVKEFQDEFFVRHALVLDTFAGPDRSAAFEEAVSVAASFACSLDTRESLLDLMFVGPRAVCFTMGRGLGQAEHALEILAAVRPARETPFTVLQHLVRQHAGMICGCICIFLDWDEPRRQLAQRLQALGLPLLVLVVADPRMAERIRSFPENKPQNFHVLEVGQIARGLETLRFA